MAVIEATKEQAGAIEAIVSYLETPTGRTHFSLGGYAGTGKTFTISEAAKTFRGKYDGRRIGFCAYTGKAANVLRQRLAVSGFNISDEDYCGTIHGMIYKPVKVKDEKTGREEVEWVRVESLPFDAIVMDEASMVTERVFEDVRSYGVPIVAVGDHGQLPPVGDRFNLMQRPDYRLEKIHRQAEGDPIVQMSVDARERGVIEFKEYGPGVFKTRDRAMVSGIKDLHEWMVLCGLNKTRCKMNEYLRGRAGLGETNGPVKNDRVICLKNNRKKGVYNGMLGTVEAARSYDEYFYDLTVRMDGMDEPYDGLVWKGQFGTERTLRGWQVGREDWQLRDQFDWGYCLTTHKAQGSEADRVLVIEERIWKMSDDDWRRWLYTAVTRSKRELIVLKT